MTGRAGVAVRVFAGLMHAIGCSECSQSSAASQRDCLSNSADFPSLRLCFSHNSFSQDLAARRRRRKLLPDHSLIQKGEKNFQFDQQENSAFSIIHGELLLHRLSPALIQHRSSGTTCPDSVFHVSTWIRGQSSSNLISNPSSAVPSELSPSSV